jgi:hypothetical protein
MAAGCLSQTDQEPQEATGVAIEGLNLGLIPPRPNLFIQWFSLSRMRRRDGDLQQAVLLTPAVAGSISLRGEEGTQRLEIRNFSAAS